MTSSSSEWEQGSVLDVAADGAAAEAATRHVPQLVEQGVASAISRQDSSLWGEAAQSEASIRLAWVGLHDTSRELVPRIEALRAELAGEGVDRVVLGMVLTVCGATSWTTYMVSS